MWPGTQCSKVTPEQRGDQKKENPSIFTMWPSDKQHQTAYQMREEENGNLNLCVEDSSSGIPCILVLFCSSQVAHECSAMGFCSLKPQSADSPIFSLCSSSEAKTLGLPPSSLPTSLFAYFCLAEISLCFHWPTSSGLVSLVAGGETHEAEREPLNMDHLSLYPHGSLRALGWCLGGPEQVQ